MSREYVEKRLREIAHEPEKTDRPAKPNSSNEIAKKPKRAQIRTRASAASPASKSDTAPAATPTVAAGPPRMYVHRKVLYEFRCSDGGKGGLTARSRCGSLFDRMLGVLAEEPAYLHPADLRRYTALIRELRQFETREWSTERSRDVPVEELPVQALAIALRHWISAAIHADRFSLAPTFRVDAARFIEAHAWGRSYYGGPGTEIWEIPPLVEGMSDQSSHSVIAESYMKGEITSGMRGRVVRFRVPTHVRLLDRSTEQTVVGPGDGFLVMDRCHLSDGPESDPYVMRVQAMDDQPMQHDIAGEFQVTGRILHAEAIQQLLAGRFEDNEPRHRQHKFDVPGRWLAAILRAPQRSDERPSWENVSHWEAGVPQA